MKRLALVILFAAAARSDPEKKSLPDFITPCRPKDDECLKNTLEQLRPYLIEGIPEFDLPPIDTFHVPNYNHSFTHAGQLRYATLLEDMKFTGVGNYSISRAHVDLDGDDARFELVVAFPEIMFLTLQTVSARGYGVEIDGGGSLNLTLSNVTISFSLSGAEQSHSHLTWEEEAIIVSYDDMSYWLEDTYKGRLDFEKFVKNLLAQSEVAKPQVERFVKNTLANGILRVLNAVHEMYPVPVLYSI